MDSWSTNSAIRTWSTNSTILSREKRNLTDAQRRAIFDALFMEVRNGKLRHGCRKEIAAMFSVDQKTVMRIWQRAKACIANGLAIDVSSKIPRKVGRKKVQIEFNKVADIPLWQRTNIRSLSKAMKVPTTTLYRRMKEGALRPHSNALKPYLSEENKRARLRFCLSMLEPYSLEDQLVFKGMYNYVHIDEKWFYMSMESEKYYLLPEEEEEPQRTCKSKRFITKVMFLAAVARPRYDTTGNEEFSGKIGIFPFINKEPAKRRSKNRAAGTMETKAILSVTKDCIRSCLIEKVLPAIRAKWPHSSVTDVIYIQQDNARPHIDAFDAKFLEEACRDGFNIRLSYQPAQSPDLNVLDLGYFRAIQSLKHQAAPRNIDELVSAVEKSFEELSADNLNRVFLTLQACMVEIMKVFGGNNYKVPHIGKGQLMKEGHLPCQLKCDRDIVERALAHLQNEHTD